MINLGFGNPIASLFRPTSAPTSAQITQQAAVTGGVETARDKVVRDKRQEAASKMIGAKTAMKRVGEKTGVDKPAAAKRG